MPDEHVGQQRDVVEVSVHHLLHGAGCPLVTSTTGPTSGVTEAWPPGPSRDATSPRTWSATSSGVRREASDGRRAAGPPWRRNSLQESNAASWVRAVARHHLLVAQRPGENPAARDSSRRTSGRPRRRPTSVEPARRRGATAPPCRRAAPARTRTADGSGRVRQERGDRTMVPASSGCPAGPRVRCSSRDLGHRREQPRPGGGETVAVRHDGPVERPGHLVDGPRLPIPASPGTTATRAGDAQRRPRLSGHGGLLRATDRGRPEDHHRPTATDRQGRRGHRPAGRPPPLDVRRCGTTSCATRRRWSSPTGRGPGGRSVRRRVGVPPDLLDGLLLGRAGDAVLRSSSFSRPIAFAPADRHPASSARRTTRALDHSSCRGRGPHHRALANPGELRRCRPRSRTALNSSAWRAARSGVRRLPCPPIRTPAPSPASAWAGRAVR